MFQANSQLNIGRNVNIESLQDTATYDSNQKNIGFDIDIAGGGAGSSLSLNGGKTDINADHRAVGQQLGIFTEDGGFDLTVGGKTTLIGGAITTTDAAVAAGRNNYTSLGGIETQDIENTTSYKGDAIQVGVSVGMTDNKPQANSNGLGYGTDSDSDSSTTRAGITGIAGNSGITTDNRAEYAGALENVFDASRVTEELGAQTQITQAFDQERRKIKTELNQDEEEARNAAKAALANGDLDAWEAYSQEADEIQQKPLIFDGISGALYGPNTNGAVGYVAKAISPQIAFQIGQAFKDNDFENSINKDNELSGVGSPQHLLAHAILGAAVSVATGNDAFAGGLGASAGEGTALILSKYIYKVDNPSELTAEQKDTISSIASLTGVALGATTGNVTDAVNAGETAVVAVQDNGLENVLLPHEIEEITNVWGTETRPITKKDFDKLVKSMSATLGFDVEDAAIHIFRPLLDSPVGAAAGLTVKITSSGIKITSKSGKVTSYTAKELAQLNASRVASKNAASDVPSASIGSNLPVIQGTPIKKATGTSNGNLGKYNKRTDVVNRSADEINATFPADWQPPYKPGTKVTEYVAATDDVFVRVHGKDNKARSWMMKREAVQGLSPEQIKSKYALPELPSYISDVHVPAGTKIRTGTVNPLPEFSGVGNSIQYELLERLPETSFKNTKRL